VIQPYAGGDRIAHVGFETVVRAEYGCDPALRVLGVCFVRLAFADDHDVAEVRRLQRA